MQEKKENESGSMMMEIIAVLAILAIMTPIVYQQALKRSREVSNINMADEMRMVKDAISAYLDANKETFLQACGSPNDLINCTSHITDIDPSLSGINPFLLRGTNYEFGTSNSEDVDYIIQVYGSYTPINATEGIYQPNLFAVLSSTSQPADLKKGRAMQIASLIGAGGGICESDRSGSPDHISGSYGAWSLYASDVTGISTICFENNTIVARTDM